EILGITRLAHFERRINKHLDKLRIAFERNFARTAAIHSVRRNKRSDDHRAGISHQFRHFAYAANVLHPVAWREPEIRVQAVSDVVAVEDIGVHAAMVQVAFERLCNGRLPSAGKSRQPDNCSSMTAPQCARAGRNFSFGPENIFALCDGSVCINAAGNRAAAADLSVIADNKAAQIRNAIMVIDDEWPTGLNRELANLISLQLFGSVA